MLGAAAQPLEEHHRECAEAVRATWEAYRGMTVLCRVPGYVQGYARPPLRFCFPVLSWARGSRQRTAPALRGLRAIQVRTPCRLTKWWLYDRALWAQLIAAGVSGEDVLGLGEHPFGET